MCFNSPEPKARVCFCHSVPSVVLPSSIRRPSSVVRKYFTLPTSSPEPLDRFWWNLVGMNNPWSLTNVVVFQPDTSRADRGRGQNSSRGSPSVVRKYFTLPTSSPEPLDRFWWNLVGMNNPWSLTNVVVFQPDTSRADRGRGQNSSRGSPSSRNVFFRPEGYSIAMI